MRKFLIAGITVCLAMTAQAQRIVVVPQAGVQTFRTEVSSNSTFFGYQKYTNASPTLGARLYYTSRKGHGPYVGLNLSEVGFVSFNGTSQRTTGVSILRYEAGYHWMTKPLYFKRIWDNGLSADDFNKLSKKGLSVQLQPSAGLFYTNNRSVGVTATSFNNLTEKEIMYSGNFGLNGGLNLLFSRNDKPLFTLSVQYFKGFGQLYSGSLSSGTNTAFQSSRGSGFQFTLGIPITLFKKKR